MWRFLKCRNTDVMRRTLLPVGHGRQIGQRGVLQNVVPVTFCPKLSRAKWCEAFPFGSTGEPDWPKGGPPVGRPGDPLSQVFMRQSMSKCVVFSSFLTMFDAESDYSSPIAPSEPEPLAVGYIWASFGIGNVLSSEGAT